MVTDRKRRRARLSQEAEPGFSILCDGRVFAGVFAEIGERKSPRSKTAAGRIPSSRQAVSYMLLEKLLQVLPLDEDDVILPQNFLEIGAGHKVVVALAPSGAVIGVIHHDGLQLCIIMAEVNDHFGKAGLQVLD